MQSSDFNNRERHLRPLVGGTVDLLVVDAAEEQLQA